MWILGHHRMVDGYSRMGKDSRRFRGLEGRAVREGRRSATPLARHSGSLPGTPRTGGLRDQRWTASPTE
jgi:hypothetical protein